MSAFIRQADVRIEQFDWGTHGWRLTPRAGARQLVVMDATIEPGREHDFHRHVGQEEISIVKRGRVIQFLEEMSLTLESGDCIFVGEGAVHATFNRADETAHLQIVISPSLGEGSGYGLVDLASEEPWASLGPRG